MKRLLFPAAARLVFAPVAFAGLALAAIAMTPWAEADEATPAAGSVIADPAAAAAAFDQGLVAEEEERWKEAADAYWKAIQADRSVWQAHVRYQLTGMRAGKPRAEVISAYDELVKELPDDTQMQLHRIRLAPAAERVAQLQPLLQAAPKDPNVNLEVGRALIESGQRAKALRPLSEALSAGGTGRIDVLLLLAAAEHREGKGQDARKRLEGALSANGELFDVHLLLARLDLLDGRFEEAGRRAEQVLQLRPTWVAAFLLKAEAHARAGRRDQAVSTLEGARGKGLETTSIRLALGDHLVGVGTDASLKTAGELYAKVLEATPQEVHALAGQAWIFEKLKKFEDAEKKYRAAAAARVGDASLLDSVGFCLLKQGRIAEAQLQLKKAIDVDPKYYASYNNLGATYDAQANYAEAIKWYEKVLKMRGQEDNLRALVNIAFDHEAGGAFEKAEDYLRKARKVRPEDSLIATWLGDNLYFREKYKEAERLYQDAIELDAKQFYAHRGLGFTLAKVRKWADAVAALEKARELKPTDVDVLLLLGYLYLQELEDYEKALAAYEAYVAAGGTDPMVPDTITALKEELGKK